MQAYDSVAIRADVELGATEQTFNLLAGRTIQEAYGQEPQVVLTLPILVGIDGERRMSKSLGNYIGVDEQPQEMFGKVMSIPDALIEQYVELASDIADDELETIRKKLSDASCNPMDLKKDLGERLVDMYHPAGSGKAAREEFTRVFSEKQLPDDMPVLNKAAIKSHDLDPDNIYLVHLLNRAGLCKSSGEARRLIKSGSVTIDGEKVSDVNYEFPLDTERVLKVGKRRFLKLIPG
jgi:tyrosyl-tRNA synthetase